jgi:hypothetical protein
MKPRVFVSSVMEKFLDYREAARRGISEAGGCPVLAEDYPGLDVSPRNACLEGVASCDIIAIIIGERGGWRTPSGKLVVEEEYEEALKQKIRILVFVQDTNHDADAQYLVDRLSDYINGKFRPTFNNHEELQLEIKKAVRPLIDYLSVGEVDLNKLQEKLSIPYQMHDHTSIRFVLSPERLEEFIDPVTLESVKLKDQIYQIAHSKEVKLFSYKYGKETEVGINEIVILQASDHRNWDETDVVRLEITSEGIISIDSNVTGLKKTELNSSLTDTFVILEDDISFRLKQCFDFAHEFFNHYDPYKRYDKFFYNAVLNNIGYRNLMKEPPKGNRMTMRQTGGEIVIAFDESRSATRAEFINSNGLTALALTMFRRRLR